LSATAVMPVAVSEQTDLDLVARHRYGDPAAFEEIYSRSNEMVYNLALRLAGDAQDAADLTQEIFLRVYRHLGQFRGGSSLKTWIYRVAVNYCRSRLSRRRFGFLPLPPRAEESIEDRRRGPEERALAGDAGRRLQAALGRLTPAFREAVVLRDLEDLSYAEIAAVLGVRVGTVRSRIARGREQLRASLEEGS
jgi:RNA polymerase sigma-70 factor, ECF subfamily